MARTNQMSDKSGMQTQGAKSAVLDGRGTLIDPKKCFNIEISDIKPKGKKAKSVDLSQGQDLEDAQACIAAYQMQATILSSDDLESMQTNIINGRFAREDCSIGTMTNHVLYRDYSKKAFNLEYLEWPTYVLLQAIYGDKMHKPYVDAAKKKWGDFTITDASHQFYKLHPEATRYAQTIDVVTDDDEDEEGGEGGDGKTTKAGKTLATTPAKKKREASSEAISAAGKKRIKKEPKTSDILPPGLKNTKQIVTLRTASPTNFAELLSNMTPPKITPPKFGPRPGKDSLGSLVPRSKKTGFEEDDLEEPEYLTSRKATAPVNSRPNPEMDAMRKDITQLKSDVVKIMANQAKLLRIMDEEKAWRDEKDQNESKVDQLLTEITKNIGDLMGRVGSLELLETEDQEE